MVAYDPCRHQGTTPRCRRSRHPCASSPHDRRRSRMPIFATFRACTPGPIFPFVAYELFGSHLFNCSVFISLFLLGFLSGPSLLARLKKPTLCEPLILFYVRLLGSWASSRPFPLLAHLRLYKRRRDPPTNLSRHLKKEMSELPLE